MVIYIYQDGSLNDYLYFDHKGKVRTLYPYTLKRERDQVWLDFIWWSKGKRIIPRANSKMKSIVTSPGQVFMITEEGIPFSLRVNKKYKLAHRVAFELANGEIPGKFIVCHTCDNPSCCNPSHLMLGTPKSNTADMLIKNRQKKADCASRGANNVNSKLLEKDVKYIRESNLNVNLLAEMFKVSKTNIRHILKRRTWRHI